MEASLAITLRVAGPAETAAENPPENASCAAAEPTHEPQQSERHEWPRIPEIHLDDFPNHLLPRILLGSTTHGDLPRFVSQCAAVCREWWQIAQESAAYCAGMQWSRVPRLIRELADDKQAKRTQFLHERARVLRNVSLGLQRAQGDGGLLNLDHRRLDGDYLNLGTLGDEGCRVMGAALPVVPQKLALLQLSGCELTPVGVALIVAPIATRGFGAAGCGLRVVAVHDNPDLGDDGLKMLADALPSTVEDLFITRTGCGDAGMMAISAAHFVVIY